MSTLDSSSSLTDVLDAYADNASYEEDGSAVKARRFVTACRILLIKIPKRSEWQAIAVTEYDPAEVRMSMERASAYAAGSSPSDNGGGAYDPVHVDFNGFRT